MHRHVEYLRCHESLGVQVKTKRYHTNVDQEQYEVRKEEDCTNSFQALGKSVICSQYVWAIETGLEIGKGLDSTRCKHKYVGSNFNQSTTSIKYVCNPSCSHCHSEPCPRKMSYPFTPFQFRHRDQVLLLYTFRSINRRELEGVLRISSFTMRLPVNPSLFPFSVRTLVVLYCRRPITVLARGQCVTWCQPTLRKRWAIPRGFRGRHLLSGLCNWLDSRWFSVFRPD